MVPRDKARVRGYVSRAHGDARFGGCAIAALASDVARTDEGSVAMVSCHLDDLVEQLTQSLQSHDKRDAMLPMAPWSAPCCGSGSRPT